MNEQSLNLGKLTRSLAYTLHQDYVQLVMKFQNSSSSSSHLTEGDDNTRRRELIEWAKEKNTLISQFRNLLRVPYDINVYETINVINSQMFQRRVHVTNIVGQLKDLAVSLNHLKVPIYAVEEALYFMKQEKKKIDYFKLDYILKAKNNNDPDYQAFEKLVKEDTPAILEADTEITTTGFFENISFCITNYFDDHHYKGEKAICQIGKLAEIELLYFPKRPIKFVMLKISLLKSLDIFTVWEDGKEHKNRLNYDLHLLTRKINQKITEEFSPNTQKEIKTILPDTIRDFEIYEEHEDEHRQLSKIMFYVKHYLRSLIFQAVNLTLEAQLEEEEISYNVAKRITKVQNYSTNTTVYVSTKFNIPVFKRRARHGFTKGKIPPNFLRLEIENTVNKHSELSQQVFAELQIRIDGYYHDPILRVDTPFKFIDSVLEIDSPGIDIIMHDDEEDGYRELEPKNISWKGSVILNLSRKETNPRDIISIVLEKARQTNLYLFASKIQKQCKILDPTGEIVKMKLEYLKDEDSSGKSDYKIRARLMIYDCLSVHFDCRQNTGKLYISDSDFLKSEQIDILNNFIHLLEFKYIEIKTLAQILCTEYFCAEFCRELKKYFLHVVKSDRMIYHFSIKKAKCMHIQRTKNDIWDIAKTNLNLSHAIVSKLKGGFYGNHLYVLLSPFDSMVSLPIFNPSSIIKADKTYNFITIEIPCDFLQKEDPRKNQFPTLPSKISDVELKFFYGRIIDQEEAQLEELSNLICVDNDLHLQPNDTFIDGVGASRTIRNFVKELVLYYKTSDQIKSNYTLFSKISQDIIFDQVNKRLLIKSFNFDLSNEFKPLKMFNEHFKPSMLEIRNSCKTWIFDVNNERTIDLMRYMHKKLGIDYFKNFLMDVDVSVVIDLKCYQIIITYERSTKYKGFIELARQVSKIFDILLYLEVQKNDKMFSFLRHYRNKSTKEFLVFQIPLGKENHINTKIKSVSFVLTYNEKNLLQQHKMDAQASSSLNVQISPNFSQSFLLCTLKKDISDIGSILNSLESSVDSLVEFNEYILGRILYPSIIDGEEKYNVTFVTRTKEELTIYYRDFFALDILFPREGRRFIFQFQIYDKAQSVFYCDPADLAYHILPIPRFHSVIKKKIEKELLGREYDSNRENYLSNDSQCIDFKTNSVREFHSCFKIIFDYLGCLYIIRNLQNENFRYQTLEMERVPDCETFELSSSGSSRFDNPNFGRFIESIKVYIVHGDPPDNSYVMIKSDEQNMEISLAEEVKNHLVERRQNCSYLKFELTLPSQEYENSTLQTNLKNVFEEFFDKKVRHKFYCWKYIRGFIFIFTTPIFKFFKPYELLNIELRQSEGGHIQMIKQKEALQRLLDQKCLNLEVLLQSLVVKKNDLLSPDVELTIRLHDKKTKKHVDLILVSKNKFDQCYICNRRCQDNNPLYEIFKYMTMSIENIEKIIAEPADNRA
ncbi:unnamed protein product [Moneuplotes crassus]|uniref:Uncharacterized protein n=3 Tax=Euplotes crassus TaxID=5936 RepID=A0AAD1U6Y9_EUPCR|nr:unnamed protein product [Moneuplotes crassus]